MQAQNVLLFTVDSCRSDRFGVYGHQPSPTPNIDRWSRQGTVFTNAYSTAAWTAPGVASILTGLYPPAHGINNRDRTGLADVVTLLKLARDSGYRVPNLNFFTFAPYYQHLGLPQIDRSYFGSEEADALLNWLDREAGAEAPFFVWFHTTLVHQPYRPNPDRLPAPLAELEKRPGIRAVLNGAIVPFGSVTFQPSDRKILNQLYNAEIERMDRFFGQVIDFLQEEKLFDKTLIILTADHGEELLDHGFVGHASTSLHAKLYEELIRIPLILSWPSHVPSGEKRDVPVSQIDLLPTVSRLLELPRPETLDGEDLFLVEDHRPLFFESVIAGNQTSKEKQDTWVRAIRKDRYKYISTDELYDLTADPRETENLYTDRPEISADLAASLKRWVSETGGRRPPVVDIRDQVDTAPSAKASCPTIFTPQDQSHLEYDTYTGAVLFQWSGNLDTPYIIEYDIATGDHHVAGEYKVIGNHQILGPFPPELWQNLKAWNPFRFRVSPQGEEMCWSDWVEFNF